MELTQAQKRIQDRRAYIEEAYHNKMEQTILSALVKTIAKKFKVTEPTIWGDLKVLGLTKSKEVKY